MNKVWTTGDDPQAALELDADAAFITDSEVIAAAKYLNKHKRYVKVHTKFSLILATVNPDVFRLITNQFD